MAHIIPKLSREPESAWNCREGNQDKKVGCLDMKDVFAWVSSADGSCLSVSVRCLVRMMSLTADSAQTEECQQSLDVASVVQ